MSEEMTPIEELRAALDKNESNHDYAIATDSVRSYLDLIEEEIKANREKFKHTKEDVIEALKYGYDVGVQHDNTINAEQYYKENHED